MHRWGREVRPGLLLLDHRTACRQSFELFTPTKVTELNRKKRIATVTFTLGKKPFSIEVPIDDDYFHADVVDVLIIGALAAVGVAHRFRDLPTRYDHTSYAFVPEDVWNRASNAGLVSSTLERKRCSEQQLVSSLPKSEGLAGLREYTESMRDAIIERVDDNHLRVLAFITDPRITTAIVEHLGVRSELPAITPARAPPDHPQADLDLGC